MSRRVYGGIPEEKSYRSLIGPVSRSHDGRRRDLLPKVAVRGNRAAETSAASDVVVQSSAGGVSDGHDAYFRRRFVSAVIDGIPVRSGQIGRAACREKECQYV